MSEAIAPIEGTFEAATMARGEPGLPRGFVWRGRPVRIAAVERVWRKLGPESTGKELYLRRHYFRLAMEDGTRWTVYCLRQPGGGARPGARWFLYAIEEKADESRP
ncbi:MAG: cytoplasmic protein [Candidatus Eisenbacteria bacterium]|nr:cytoplasmic protein [Candidatus Eisenbacteria bacterium]